MPSSISYNEPEVLRSVAVGDEAAFKTLFYHWQPFLSGHIYRITESAVITEEIVQDVFLKIWQTRETVEQIVNFKAYLLVISKNHAINTLKKIARDAAKQQQYSSSYLAPHDDDNSHAWYSLIDEAIEQLSPRQREVFLLSRRHQKTYQQIAVLLGIGKESVKTHLGLAVKHISHYVTSRLAALFVLFVI